MKGFDFQNKSSSHRFLSFLPILSISDFLDLPLRNVFVYLIWLVNVLNWLGETQITVLIQCNGLELWIFMDAY